MRRKVSGQANIPGNWSDFLRDLNDKQELFQFLSDKIGCTDCPTGRQIFITSGATMVSRGTGHCMSLCDDDDADTRIVVHLLDALDCGYAICVVRTVDTDVVAILIGKFNSIIDKYPTADIWVAFGTGKGFMYLHIGSIATT